MPWQELFVGIIVVVAALYAGAKYLPASWRRALVHRLSGGGRASTRAKRLVAWLDTSASCGSGCGSCASCATPQPTPPSSGEPGRGRVIKIHQHR
ncbi:DUF6587 family protein [Massilia sp. H6]|uniref:DUF6587 family protein n=1 Tax=Massilia sp. H6 TaxID=2970464 RepID=UPI002167A0BF|nr:DUF6587 family protein [Massilia sp. H6]UVW28478.1 hypothetical protein NRS07_18510 [Massilia sp. H6]